MIVHHLTNGYNACRRKVLCYHGILVDKIYSKYFLPCKSTFTGRVCKSRSLTVLSHRSEKNALCQTKISKPKVPSYVYLSFIKRARFFSLFSHHFCVASFICLFGRSMNALTLFLEHYRVFFENGANYGRWV